MDFKNLITTRRILFVLLFGAIALLGYQLNFSSIVGSEAQYFTFFQFFGPIAGGFLGPIAGATAVLAAVVGNFLLVGKEATLVNLFRLTPMLFAAYYFAKGRKEVSIAVPLACMAAFWLHPVGAQAWYYALYWLIPVFGKIFSKRLFFKSLGATFTAHAIGSTIFLYTVPMPAEAWIALIPIVAMERILFALGITGSFIAFTNVLAYVESKIPMQVLHIDHKYVLSKDFFRIRA